MAKLVEIICDGGGGFGYGHIRRCKTLAEALNKKGYRVKLRIPSKETVNNYAYDVDSEAPVLTLIDMPYEMDYFVLEAKKKGTRCIALDYFGDANPNLTVSIFEHKKGLPAGDRVSGFKYAIIRPTISIQRAETGMGAVIIMIGGSDIHDVGVNVAVKVSSFSANINLIKGPINISDYRVTNGAIKILKDPQDLEKIMASSDWGVTNGGGSMMEMMSLGKAIYVIPQTQEENNLARYLLHQGAILGIGIESIKLPSREEIDFVGGKAKLLIDGCGVERIVGHVMEEIEKFQCSQPLN